jgi:asparagine synthase (glutamine-hydrolysing)
MCGIAGVIDWNGDQREKISIFEEMQSAMRRRGPDQGGIFVENPAALIHTRLCVVDIENGRQPMRLCRGEEEYTLVYNGELYNTGELRAQLKERGHSFLGHSDTEVLLHSYAEWGEDCVNYFNGIFAFAIWEKHNRRLFLARDRIGVKPLFFALRGESIIFASELQTLICHPSVKPEADISSVCEIILLGPGRTPGCGVLRGVEELLPAHCGYYGKTGLSVRKYWDLKDREHRDSFEQTVETVRELVTDSVKRQLVSDVEVCTLLSGGLDSSIISSVASRHFGEMGKKLHTFSVDYIDNERYFKPGKFQPNSDNEYIKIMTGYLGTEHHRVVLNTEELADALYSAVDARGLPGMADVDSSMLLLFSKVKEHATVALSGECADEIFGGYPWFRDREIRERYGFPWAQSTEYRAGFLKHEYLSQIDPYEYIDRRYKKTLSETSSLPGAGKEEKRMKEMSALNMHWFMQTLLDRKDRMSMYNGLEVRVPFCDYRIAEYLYSVPWEYKDYNNTEKGLLRMAMKDILPEEVLWRKKSPYPKTHHPVYLETVRRRLEEVINDTSSPILGIIKKEALEKLLDDDNAVPWYGQLMTTPQTIAYFLQFNYWLDRFNISIK